LKKFVLFFVVILFFAFLVKGQSSLEKQKSVFTTKAKLNKELEKETLSLAKGLLREIRKSQRAYSNAIKKAMRTKIKNPEDEFLLAKLLVGSGLILETKINADILALQLILTQLNNETDVRTDKIQKVFEEICLRQKINIQQLKILGKLVES